MKMVHVICKYLRVKTKVTDNTPKRYILAHYVSGKFLINKEQAFNQNKHSFLWSRFVMGFCQKIPPPP